MGLRRGVARWGLAALFISLVAGGMLLFSPTEAQESSENFDFSGFIKFPNGSFINGTNITIKAINFSSPTFPPPTVGVFSNLSGPDGFFNVTNITGGVNYLITIIKFNSTNNTLASFIGPTLPPVPSFFLTNSVFETVYLGLPTPHSSSRRRETSSWRLSIPLVVK